MDRLIKKIFLDLTLIAGLILALLYPQVLVIQYFKKAIILFLWFILVSIILKYFLLCNVNKENSKKSLYKEASRILKDNPVYKNYFAYKAYDFITFFTLIFLLILLGNIWLSITYIFITYLLENLIKTKSKELIEGCANG